MSGSDGAVGGGLAWDAGGEENDCARVVLDVALDPPDPDESFDIGHEYDVVLVTSGPAETVQAINAEGRPVGAIRPHQALLRCLRNGVLFFAVVTSVDGGQIVVRVRART